MTAGPQENARATTAQAAAKRPKRGTKRPPKRSTASPAPPSQSSPRLAPTTWPSHGPVRTVTARPA
jgi:hypothetical protein